MIEAKEDLLKDYATWIEVKAKKEARLPRWQTLLHLAKHAESLPVSKQVPPQIQAIQGNRSLLADPDPVPPLISKLTDALRKAVQDAAQGLMEIYQREMEALKDTDVWIQLDQSQQASILSQALIAEPIEVEVGTETTLLEVLDSRPLSTWQSRMDAQPVRFESAHTQAARILEPQSVKVVPKPATLKSLDDLDAYLEDLRSEVQLHLDQGDPVVISRS